MTPLGTRVLAAAGYITEAGDPMGGLVRFDIPPTSASDEARLGPLLKGVMAADAVFRVGTSPAIVFKSSLEVTDDEPQWHRLAWNFGAAPLLWVTTPRYIRLYNAYEPPEDYGRRSPLLKQFPLDGDLDRILADVTAVCGRRHIVMGSFWSSEIGLQIDRRRRVDHVLVGELIHLLRALVTGGIRTSLAQKLVGRCIFFQYLVHRGYVSELEMAERFGAPHLNQILTDLNGTYELFRWIRRTFNGDLFPLEDEDMERTQLCDDARLLQPLSDFFGHFNVLDRQGRLFPFRFDAIPVELISAIYEKFVHMSQADGEPIRGVHYTPINIVDLVLDPVFENLSPSARVLDMACGSGVFLVESLRRLVWLNTQTQQRTRELVRRILMQQVRGVDISPAALPVAAFSLYLALLELDPNPPRGLDALDCLRFDPLQGRVLFATSAFNPALSERIAASHDHREHLFDAIIGNPPWTYSAKEKEEDRVLAEAPRDATQVGKDLGESETGGCAASDQQDKLSQDDERRSGTTYARLEHLPIPGRSMDWPFLWRCRDFCHTATRIALVMKATPFFSLDPKTSSARDALFRAFPSVDIINLSQLRMSSLFQEHEHQENGERPKKKNKKTAGPALLFFSNCLPSEPETVTALNLPWTPDFRRTGVFELPAEPARSILIDVARREPGLLKVTVFGAERDAWFLERLANSKHAIKLVDWWSELALPAGQGYQSGTGTPAAHLKDLPRVTSRDFRRKLAPNLPLFKDDEVHRARDAEIFRGPLVLLPEGSLSVAAEHGRYVAAFDSRDLAYSESFLGVSFKGRDPLFARAFAAVMSSSLVAYQIAFLGGTVGVKQTKVEAVDLETIRIPRLDRVQPETLTVLAAAADTIASHSEPRILSSALSTIDRIVETEMHLTDSDRELLTDAIRRARAIFFETRDARLPMEVTPTDEELNKYAQALASTFNAFATHNDDLVLVPVCHERKAKDVIVVKLSLMERATGHDCALKPGIISELGKASLSELGGPDLPYLKPATSLRLYIDKSVYLVKPAHYRCFSPSLGQSDGDSIIAEIMQPNLLASLH